MIDKDLIERAKKFERDNPDGMTGRWWEWSRDFAVQFAKQEIERERQHLKDKIMETAKQRGTESCILIRELQEILK